MEDQNSEEVQMAPGGINGSLVVQLFAVFLIASTFLIGWPLWTYSRFEKVEAETNAAWRSVATQLGNRYAEMIATLSANSNAADSSKGEIEPLLKKLRAMVDSFKTTADPVAQHATAQAIEALLDSGAPHASDSPLVPLLEQPDPQLVLSIASYHETISAETDVANSLGGRLLGLVIHLPIPDRFDLANNR